MISVIIPHLNQPEMLRRCLSSLANGADPRLSVEIIVVDNGSKQMPVEVCSAFRNVRLLSQPVPGPGPARNLGVANATGDTLAFIDADCVAGGGWLNQIEHEFSLDADKSILGGDVRIGCENPDRPTLLEAYESVFAYRMKEYIAKQGFTGTGNLAVRAKVFAAVGEFGGIDIAEDRDWGQRALKSGYQTHYCENMIAYHPARKSFSELALKWQRHTAHDLARVKGRRGWRLLWIARAAALTLSPVAEVRRICVSERLNSWRARGLAFVGLVLIRSYRAAIMLSLACGATDATTLSGRWNPQSMTGTSSRKA
ncbi:glycosyltransferase family 2 protein [Rhizobium sp. BK661]|uniref:glycosyltransferase family 2 protein n=1 Tax=Rhizobium sp. BK661 TaxID=2586991 RepID=UPI0021684797|nr:glycosyltransferase [Rhizobium sp. BK661]MCS3742963.1 glycosyltransferase involved in cell wall biosynthesis [Rhizobium sp. BK661]